MRKFYIILMTILLVLTMTVSAGATDYAEPMTEVSTEAAETPTEAVETMTEDAATEAQTEAETSPIEADSDISAILNAATPEQIEKIEQFIIYGVSTLPFPDQVRVFCTENLEAIAWIVFGIIFLASVIGFCKSRKKNTREIQTMTDNAISIVEQAEENMENIHTQMNENNAKAKADMAEALEAFTRMIADVRADIKAQMDDTEKKSEKAIAEADEVAKAAIKLMEELKSRETGLTESEVLMATILNDLVQNSNLPQWKKDEFSIHLNEGVSKIAEVAKDEEQA